MKRITMSTITACLALLLLILNFPHQVYGFATSYNPPTIKRSQCLSIEKVVPLKISTAILKGAEQLPTATAEKIPNWRGVNLPNKIEYDCFYIPEITDMYEEKVIKDIADLGFNFIRVPIHYKLIFPYDSDPLLVNMKQIENIDNLIKWGIKYKVHINLDMHNVPGSNHNMSDSERILFKNKEQQNLLVQYWQMFGRRYAGISSNALSFNLINEPPNYVSDEDYSTFMKKIIDVIRVYDKQRLIIVDGLSYGKKPVMGLVKSGVVQSFHQYEPNFACAGKEFGINPIQWPIQQVNGFICDFESPHRGPFTINGDFKAGTKFKYQIGSLCGKGTVLIKADGQEIFRQVFGLPTVGVDGCNGVYEAGTSGQYGDYGTSYELPLPAAAKKIELFATDGIVWLDLIDIKIKSNKENIDIVIYSPDISDPIQTPPTSITINPDGTYRNENTQFQEMGYEYLKEKAKAIHDFSVQNNVQVMVGEFGVWREVPHEWSLTYLNDWLKALKEYNIPWAAWDYYGPFGFLNSDRTDVKYEKYGKFKLDREMLNLYQKYQH